MTAKILETERLKLSPFTPTDRDLLQGIFADPTVREYLWDDEIIDLDQTAEILTENERLFSEARYGLWKIELKDAECSDPDNQRTAMGFVGLWFFFEEEQPQLLYGLLPAFTGQGYASEASRCIIQYALETLGFDYLLAAIDAPHRVSQKVAERIGMRLVEERTIDDKPTVFYRIEK